MCRDAGRGLDEPHDEIVVFLPIQQLHRQSASQAQMRKQEFAPVRCGLFDGSGVGVRPGGPQQAFEEAVESWKRRLG